MDPFTLDYYASHAEAVARSYENAPCALKSRFATAFSPKGRILDIGCGSGRDMAELARQGFSSFGIDGTAAFVNLAQNYHPELRGKIEHALLPDFAVPFGGEFDGVLCSAVLMHIDAPDVFNAALSMLTIVMRMVGYLKHITQHIYV